MSMPSLPEIQSAFNLQAPELESRLRRCSKLFADVDESFSEMFCSCWLNFRSKAMRTGEFLRPSALAWAAFIRHRSGRTSVGFSVRDVLAPQTFRLNRVRVVSLAQLSTNKLRHRLDDKMAERITTALCSSEHERPPVLAARKIDWAAFADTLPHRLRKILSGLAIGEGKSALARQLRISPGRLTQLLDVLAERIREFFGVENLPACCAA